VATATPSPNRYKELIHYAGFLGIMDTGQALTRFFQRNSEKAGDLTLYPHKEHEFWLWVASWGLFLQKPSDLGFSDDGYVLPPLKLRWHEVQSYISGGVEKNGQYLLLNVDAVGLSGEAKERRATLAARIAKGKEIRDAAPDEHFLLWHDLEDERRAIEAAFPDAKSIYGTQDIDEREGRVIDFSDGRIKDLAAKPVIAGSGCNFQRHCRRAIFFGANHKFNDLIQAVHRIYRFGQAGEVEIDIIHSERERHVRRDIEAKWSRHTEMVGRMSEIIRHYGLNAVEMTQVLARSIGVERIEAAGKNWRMANNDCVDECRRMADGCIDMVVTSIPFANHYEYTPKYDDFGHTDDNAHFFAQLDFLTPELLRILAPGRLACIHVKDRVEFGSVTGTGMPTVDPFHADCIAHYRRHGFLFMGMITVVTDVVRENNQTYRLGYTEMLKDSTKMGVGCPEYVLLLRKPQSDKGRAYADRPVVKSDKDYSLARWQIDAHAFWRSSGNRLLTPDEMTSLPPNARQKLFTENSLRQIYDFEHHVAIGERLQASGQLPSTFMSLAPGSADPGVWHDVVRMRTLNGAQAAQGREKHLCPLQFDIVDRLIERYSNKGELVFDPFGGLGTVPVRALKLGRRGAAVELSADYFCDAVKYLQAQEEAMAMPDLFAALSTEIAA
jgi:DNA modification methylase